MTIYRNEGRFDTSNVVFRDGEIIVYDKKSKLPEMQYIDYGLSLFKSSVFDEYAADQAFDLAEVMHRLVGQKQLAGYEVPERFYEMGSPAGLAELEALLRTLIKLSFHSTPEIRNLKSTMSFCQRISR